ncbi:hypothetical protein WJX84_005997 [Apatococcus fuscideae]|uniref:Uncharacterized protein n=1 Tax=Apatococcus fuscideae TaxID=2026836 RepID=A0AAW1TH92_9CHLO
MAISYQPTAHAPVGRKPRPSPTYEQFALVAAWPDFVHRALPSVQAWASTDSLSGLHVAFGSRLTKGLFSSSCKLLEEASAPGAVVPTVHQIASARRTSTADIIRGCNLSPSVPTVVSDFRSQTKALAKQRHCMKASVTEQRADGLDADLSQESALKTELALTSRLSSPGRDKRKAPAPESPRLSRHRPTSSSFERATAPSGAALDGKVWVRHSKFCLLPWD